MSSIPEAENVQSRMEVIKMVFGESNQYKTAHEMEELL